MGIVDSEQGIGSGKSMKIDTHAVTYDIEATLPISNQRMNDQDIGRAVLQLYNMTSMALDTQHKRMETLQAIDLTTMPGNQRRGLSILIEEQQWVLDFLEEMSKLSSAEAPIDDHKEAIRRLFFQDYH